ncbi:Alpha/Beta hydrolase protein [Xylariaceae sp. FL0804]|nr:Alpha/Beta hydrolase protein [Xylariaceae sp. FL0804]
MPDDSSNPARREAAAILARDCFHRRFTLPATADHEALTVSYADAGRAPADPAAAAAAGAPGSLSSSSSQPQPPTVVFIPGMFASRYFALLVHPVAEKLGVRVLVIDRPGMGHSTNVPPERRLATWIEVLPRLLEHLGIRHVSLASHSAGTMFLLNTLYECRDILDPERPFVAMMGPFVHPSNSGQALMKAAGIIPNKAFAAWNSIPRVLRGLSPAFSASGTAIGWVSNAFGSGGGGEGSVSQVEQNRRRMERDYGLPRDVRAQLETLAMDAMFREDTVGANSEALACLKKGPGGSWGRCEDAAAFVRDLADLERRRRPSRTAEEPAGRSSAPLKVRVFYAEDDMLSGEKGKAYVEECWKGQDIDDFGNLVHFASETVEKTDHDGVATSVLALTELFLEVGGQRARVEGVT